MGFTAPVDTESWYPHYLNLICETCTEGVKGRSQRGAHTCEPTTEMFGPTAPELRDDLSPPKKLDSGQSCLDIEFLSINYRGLNFPNFPIELGGGNSAESGILQPSLPMKQWNPREGARPLSRGRRNGPGPRGCSRRVSAGMEETLMRVPTGASL